MILTDDGGHQVAVPDHPGRDLKPGTLRSIIADAGLDVTGFVRLLK